MKVADHLHRLGGVSDRSHLVEVSSRRAVDRALRRGEIVADGRGRYTLATVSAGRRAAHAMSAVLSHRSAAAHWGWEQVRPPERPDVIVPRNRKVSTERRATVNLHWADLRPNDVCAGVTSPERTLVDCMRSLSFDEALAIADSALRHDDVAPDRLQTLAAAVVGPGAARARSVAAAADGRSANPFESSLRAIALAVPGLHVEPQVAVVLPGTGAGRVDLADRRLRIVAEADSFGWHGSRRALWRDCRRYNRLVLQGWLVLRFAWEDVMLHPDYVLDCLAQAVDVVRRRARSHGTRRHAA